MSWAVGWDTNWNRWVGYGVPATCDQPGCGAEIDRGLAYVCGAEPYGGEHGCGLYFCGKHGGGMSECEHGDDLTPTADTPEWIAHMLEDPSWAEWRSENVDWVIAMGHAASLP